MYCKNCGRQLKEGMRFCDRCGQSVRKSTEGSQAVKRREIEELQAERRNRKMRLEEKEAKQARGKKRKKRKGGTFIFFIVIILVAIGSVILGYNIFPKTGDGGSSVETSAPESSPSYSPVNSTPNTPQDKYSEITVGNITCPYPTAFYSNPTSGNEELNLNDALGGAVMIVAKDGRSGEMTDLIRDYITEIGATDNPEMRAGNDWYYVTATVDGKVYHRKCIVRNGLSVYYDFTYDASSTSSKKYEEYIGYIDSKFNGS